MHSNRRTGKKTGVRSEKVKVDDVVVFHPLMPQLMAAEEMFKYILATGRLQVPDLSSQGDQCLVEPVHTEVVEVAGKSHHVVSRYYVNPEILHVCAVAFAIGTEKLMQTGYSWLYLVAPSEWSMVSCYSSNISYYDLECIIMQREMAKVLIRYKRDDVGVTFIPSYCTAYGYSEPMTAMEFFREHAREDDVLGRVSTDGMRLFKSTVSVSAWSSSATKAYALHFKDSVIRFHEEYIAPLIAKRDGIVTVKWPTYVYDRQKVRDTSVYPNVVLVEDLRGTPCNEPVEVAIDATGVTFVFSPKGKALSRVVELFLRETPVFLKNKFGTGGAFQFPGAGYCWLEMIPAESRGLAAQVLPPFMGPSALRHLRLDDQPRLSLVGDDPVVRHVQVVEDGITARELLDMLDPGEVLGACEAPTSIQRRVERYKAYHECLIYLTLRGGAVARPEFADFSVDVVRDYERVVVFDRRFRDYLISQDINACMLHEYIVENPVESLAVVSFGWHDDCDDPQYVSTLLYGCRKFGLFKAGLSRQMLYSDVGWSPGWGQQKTLDLLTDIVLEARSCWPRSL